MSSSKMVRRTASRTTRPARSALTASAPLLASAGAGSAHARIIAAARDMIAGRGPNRFSMTEVSRVARISRQTLYRYFRSKPELLEGVIADLKQRIAVGLTAAIEADPSWDGRINALAGYNLKPAERNEIERLLRKEPAFLVQFLQSFTLEIRQLVERVVEPFIDAAEREHGIAINRGLVIETLVRLRVSLFFMPDAGSPAQGRLLVRAVILGVVEAPGAWAAAETPARRQRMLGAD